MRVASLPMTWPAGLDFGLGRVCFGGCFGNSKCLVFRAVDGDGFGFSFLCELSITGTPVDHLETHLGRR